MNLKTINPLHQPETEFNGEFQVFSGPALAPDDPILEPRLRKRRPGTAEKHSSAEEKDRQEKE